MLPIENMVRTEAQQREINQTRLDAELHRIRLEANFQAQQAQFAEFMGAAMQREEARKPHVTYHVYSGGSPPPPPPPSPAAVDPNREVVALERRLEQERQQSQLMLHEATASTKASVNAVVSQMQGEVKKAQDMARAAAAASTDEIRENRGRPEWTDALALELREARGQITTMQDERKAFLEQQVANEVEKAKRAKKRNDELTASSSSGPPPPPPDAGRVKKPKTVTIPINNPAQYTASNQPTGAQVPGPHAAVMPNASGMPANPTPTVDNTRDDDKPLPKSMREGAMTVKKNNKQTAKQKEKTRQARLEAKARREQEEREDNAPLVAPKKKPKPPDDDSDDDKPLVAPRPRPKGKARPKGLPKPPDDDTPAPRPKARPKKRVGPAKPVKPSIVIETALPAPKKRVKRAEPSEKQEDVQDILRASRRAATSNPARNKVERFIIADPPEAEKRKAVGMSMPRLRRKVIPELS